VHCVILRIVLLHEDRTSARILKYRVVSIITENVDERPNSNFPMYYVDELEWFSSCLCDASSNGRGNARERRPFRRISANLVYDRGKADPSISRIHLYTRSNGGDRETIIMTVRRSSRENVSPETRVVVYTGGGTQQIIGTP